MFFYLSKLVWLVAVPSNFLVLLTLLGLAATWRWRRAGVGLAAASSLLLVAIGVGPVSTWALLPLEDRFPPYRDDGPVAGVITLGGGIYADVSGARGQLSLGEANERLIALADLARRHPEAQLVYAGGSGALVFDELTEAEGVRRYGGMLGLDTARVRYDATSRTTYENAVNTRALIEPKPGERWLLVTSARHMPRSVGCFRAVGIEPVPYPVDYLTRGRQDIWSAQPTVALGLNRFDDAVREWMGLVAYRLTGRTDALFPAP